MRRTFLLLTFILAIAVVTQAQRGQPLDSIPTRSLDSIAPLPSDEIIAIDTYAAKFDPQRALLLAAIFPGAGQIYNKKYWKVPIVYGGFAALGYGMYKLHGNYIMLKDMLFNILNEPASPIIINKDTGETSLGNFVHGSNIVSPKYGFTLEQLRSQVTKWRRDRDFTLMLTAGWYLLQMVDAHVDAHLKEFDVNPELKVSIEPAMDYNAMTGRTSGVSLKLKF